MLSVILRCGDQDKNPTGQYITVKNLKTDGTSLGDELGGWYVAQYSFERLQ